jgi:hypothetical protein
MKNQFGEQSNNYIIGGSNQFDCNFVVDSTNGNGLGIRSLKGNKNISAIYMNTSATPATGNPNPAAGLILVKLLSGYSGYIGGYGGFSPPVSGTPINVTAGLTPGNAYIITSLGTTSLAAWQALGLPVGVVPAIGGFFIAITATAGTGTGVVEVPLAAGAGADNIQIIGDPNTAAAPSSGGSIILMGCYGPTSTSVTTPKLIAPANNSVVGLRIVMNGPGGSDL